MPCLRRGYTSIRSDDDEKENPSKSSCIQDNKAVPTFILLLSLCTLLYLLTPGHLIEEPMLRLSTPLGDIPFAPMPHPMSPSVYWGSVSLPYPTGAFWTNLVIDDGDGAVGAYPYGLKCLPAGVQISYGAARRLMVPLSVTDIFAADIQVSAVEGFVSRGVTAYDNVSVTMKYLVSGGGSYVAPIVKGSPFVTVVFNNATPVISSEEMIIESVENLELPKGIEGSLQLLTMGNFLKWIVYCSNLLNISGHGTSKILTSTIPIVGIVRVALVPLGNEKMSIATLKSSLRTYPIGAVVNISRQSSSATDLIFKFQTVAHPAKSEDDLLMLALPHQIAILNEGERTFVLDDSAYGPCICTKGILHPIKGRVWSLSYDLVSVGWNFDTEGSLFPIAALNTIASVLREELNGTQPQNDPDPYGFGKELSRMANLALVSDFLGIPDCRHRALQYLKTMIRPWVSNTNTDYLVYDITWGGVVSSEGLQNSLADFGNGWYNDHHFHYGYIIYAGAVMAHLQPSILTGADRYFLQTLVRDICNGNSNDPAFPFVRNKDFFDGHSWASGLFQQANGKSQESSSEAINAYYGCYLYGLATNDINLSAFSQLLLTMEIQAVKHYWHMENSNVYDPQFASNRMAGVVGSMSVSASTWFGAEPEYVHGINIMPVTAVTSQLFDQEFAAKQFPILFRRLSSTFNSNPSCSANSGCSSLGIAGACCPTSDGITLACCENGVPGSIMSGEFESLILADQALVDKTRAWTDFLRPTLNPGVGASRANYLLWVASRPEASTNNMTYVELENLIKRETDSTAIRRNCSANSACIALGFITGVCCPNQGGTMLACCPQQAVSSVKIFND